MIIGIEAEIQFAPPAPLTDEWIDALYSSLESNMAVKSIDMFADETAGTLSFLLGIEGFDHCGEDFFIDVAREAVERALEDAAGPNKRSEAESPKLERLASFAA